jgi:alpha-glucosidase
MLLLTLPGTLTLYYGEEIGMTNVPIAPEDAKDPAEKNEPGIGMGRDPERTPMPWDDTPLAGFTTGKPWLPLGPDHASVNVARLNQDEKSILHLYRNLISLRRAHSALVVGEMRSIAADRSLLRYERVGGAERFLILLNMGHDPIEVVSENGTICMSTGLDREGDLVNGSVELRTSEGIIIRLAVPLVSS